MRRVVGSCRRPNEDKKLVEASRAPSSMQYTLAADSPLCPKVNEILRSARRALRKARAVEEALRMNEQRAQETIETAPCAIVTMDDAGAVTEWNGQAEKLFGWSREEALGQNMIPNIVPPQHQESLEQSLKRFAETGEGLTWNKPIETTALDRSGREFAIEIAISPMKCLDRWSFNAFIQDISERKRDISERKKKEEIQVWRDEQNRLLLDATSFAAAIGLVLTQNPVLETALEKSAGAFVDTLGTACTLIWTVDQESGELKLAVSAGTFASADVAASVESRVRRIADSGTPDLCNDLTNDPEFSATEWAKLEGLTAFAGHPLSVEGRVVGVTASFGRTPFLGTVLRALATASTQLAQFIARKIMEQQLLHAQETSVAARRAKSEFLSNMSHEIRTPMNGILAMADLAMETELTSEQRLYLSIVVHSAEALVKIVDDIFDFTTIEAPKLKLEHAEFDLPATLAATVQALAGLAEKKNLSLACDVDPGVPSTVIGDAPRLRQVLTILLNNGIKVTQSGKVHLRVARAVDPAEENMLYFSVRDTGIGISQDHQQLIFQAFTQADGSSTRPFGGTGLGLAMASRLVEMMGGRIWVESEVGKGSTFHFTVQFGGGSSQNAD